MNIKRQEPTLGIQAVKSDRAEPTLDIRSDLQVADFEPRLDIAPVEPSLDEPRLEVDPVDVFTLEGFGQGEWQGNEPRSFTLDEAEYDVIEAPFEPRLDVDAGVDSAASGRVDDHTSMAEPAQERMPPAASAGGHDSRFQAPKPEDSGAGDATLEHAEEVRGPDTGGHIAADAAWAPAVWSVRTPAQQELDLGASPLVPTGDSVQPQPAQQDGLAGQSPAMREQVPQLHGYSDGGHAPGATPPVGALPSIARVSEASETAQVKQGHMVWQQRPAPIPQAPVQPAWPPVQASLASQVVNGDELPALVRAETVQAPEQAGTLRTAMRPIEGQATHSRVSQARASSAMAATPVSAGEKDHGQSAASNGQAVDRPTAAPFVSPAPAAHDDAGVKAEARHVPHASPTAPDAETSTDAATYDFAERTSSTGNGADPFANTDAGASGPAAHEAAFQPDLAEPEGELPSWLRRWGGDLLIWGMGIAAVALAVAGVLWFRYENRITQDLQMVATQRSNQAHGKIETLASQALKNADAALAKSAGAPLDGTTGADSGAVPGSADANSSNGGTENGMATAPGTLDVAPAAAAATAATAAALQSAGSPAGAGLTTPGTSAVAPVATVAGQPTDVPPLVLLPRSSSSKANAQGGQAIDGASAAVGAKPAKAAQSAPKSRAAKAAGKSSKTLARNRAAAKAERAKARKAKAVARKTVATRRCRMGELARNCKR